MADKNDTEDKELAAEKPEGEEGEGAQDAGDESSGGGSKKKIAIIAAAALLLLCGAGAGAYFMGYLDGLFGHDKPDCEHAREGDEDYELCLELKAREAAGAPGHFVDIPDLIVNLNTATRTPHFLKISIKVELENPAQEKLFEEVRPRVIDQFQTYLRELRMEDLRGSSGLYRMKLELLSRVKAAAPAVKVRDVLFQEILVQ